MARSEGCSVQLYEDSIRLLAVRVPGLALDHTTHIRLATSFLEGALMLVHKIVMPFVTPVPGMEELAGATMLHLLYEYLHVLVGGNP